MIWCKLNARWIPSHAQENHKHWCQFWLFYILITAHHIKNACSRPLNTRYRMTPPANNGSILPNVEWWCCCEALNLLGCDFRSFPSLWGKDFDTQNQLQHIFIHSLSHQHWTCHSTFFCYSVNYSSKELHKCNALELHLCLYVIAGWDWH